MKKIATHILYCDECLDLIMPKMSYYPVNGKIICAVCWEEPDNHQPQKEER